MGRRLWLIIFILLAIILSVWGYIHFTTPTQAPEGSSAVAEEISNVVWASAKVLPVRRAVLSFSASGRLDEILVAEGDRVAAGQVMARLDATMLERAVSQAEAHLAVSQAQLAQVKAGHRTEEVAAAREGVAAAQAQLAAAAARLAAAQADIQRAQAECDRADAAQAKLLAGPTSHELDLARMAIDAARDQLYGAQAQRDSIGGAVKRMEATQSDYDAAQAAVLQAEGGVRKAQVQLEQLEAGPATQEKAMAAASVSAAQAALVAAQAQVSALQAQVAAAQATVRQAERQLQLLEAGPTGEQVSLAQAEVRLNQTALEASRAQLEQAILRAPFTGTVGILNIRPGEVVAAGQPALTLGDLDYLWIETTDLRETDITRVRPGQPVEITLDSLPEEKLSGSVVRITPMATQGQGGTNYTVYVAFDRQDARLRWGMTAYANITVGK